MAGNNPANLNNEARVNATLERLSAAWSVDGVSSVIGGRW